VSRVNRKCVAGLLAGCLLGLSIWPVFADPVTKEQSFTTHRALLLEGEGPWYRLDLPATLRLASQRADFADIRVFDAQGVAMPFSLLRPQTEYKVSEQRQEVAIFPLYSESQSDADPAPTVRLQSNARGTLIEVIPDAGEAETQAGVRRGWLLDTSGIEGEMVRMSLDWVAAEEIPSLQRFAIEGSDDLQQWHALGTGQAVHMTFDGAEIDQREVRLPGLSNRYLRLIWQQPSQAPMLQGVSVVENRTLSKIPSLSWSSPLSAERTADGDYRLQLPRAMRLERMRIGLPQINTLAPLTVSGGYLDRKGREVWSPLGEGLVYRLSLNGDEAQQNEIPLSSRAFDLFRVQASGGGLDMPRLKIKLGLAPMQLVFLARGEAPYRLSLGNRKAVMAGLPLDSLMPPIEGVTPEASTARLGEAMGTVPAAEAMSGAGGRAAWSWKNFLLWGVLFVGVILLVFMTAHILRSSK
jgi:hypothetical protein